METSSGQTSRILASNNSSQTEAASRFGLIQALAVMTHSKRCPICNICLPLEGDEIVDHLFKRHPLSKPRGMDLAEYYFEYLPEYEKHLIRVLNGEEILSAKYEKYIVRSASDYVRYVAQGNIHKTKIILNTDISSPSARSSNITYATKKKRKP
jgi:hypothetical protein